MWTLQTRPAVMWDNSCGPHKPDHHSWLPVLATAELNRRLIWLGTEESLTPEQWNTKWLLFQIFFFCLNSKMSVTGSPFARVPHSPKEWLSTLDALLSRGCMCLGLFCLFTVWDSGLGYVGDGTQRQSLWFEQKPISQRQPFSLGHRLQIWNSKIMERRKQVVWEDRNGLRVVGISSEMKEQNQDLPVKKWSNL